MEFFGVVAAVGGLVDPLIHLGRYTSTSVQRSSHFGGDAEKLRVSFKHARRQVEAMRGLLLMRAEGSGVDTTVFEQFTNESQTDLLGELRQLRALTRDLEEIEDRYGIFAARPATRSLQGQPLTEEVVELALADNREAELQKAATKLQLIRWGMKDAKRAAKILGELLEWVRLFKADIEMCLWTCFKTPDKLQLLHQHTDVAALGLAGAVELRQILLQTTNPTTIKRFELKSRPQIQANLSGTLALGTYNDQSAVIEYKSYEPNEDASVPERTTYRVCQLVALLSRSPNPEAGPSLRVLRCIGYYIEPGESRYSFIYNIPSNLRPEPVSLLTAMSAKDQRYRSTIKHRVRLAYYLALSVYQLHLVGWVHKSIRSENILFFPDVPSAAGEDPEPNVGPVVPDVLTHRDTKKIYTEPWLFGFDYSRVISQDSDRVTDTTILRNIYRHPQRWNAPTHDFGAIHDIYALGTVLLELGLWQPLASLSSSGFARAAEAASSPNDPAARSTKDRIQSQLLEYAAKRLPFTLGRSYCEVVELCLGGADGREGFDVDENDHNVLVKSFREKVVDRLGKALLTG